MNNDALYTKIMAFQFDAGPVSLTFTERLERENGWALSYASRTVNEYLRFIYLLATSGQPLTPSDQVDQVWHLHLTYTESYWQRLCTEIVGRPLHHTPTRGGVDESNKFYSWYNRTLLVYKQVFGHAPPSDIWPSPEIRFGEDLNFQRVNTSQCLVVRMPQMLRTQWFANCLLTLGVLAIAIGLFFREWRLLIFVGVIAVLLFLYFRANRCLTCQSYGALEATGVVETRADKKEYLELRCKYCDTKVWKERDADGGCGGGGGCGGCGG